MPRGAPDYSNVSAGETLHRLDDLAELAVRLHAVRSIDRAGEVVLAEDFRYGVSALETDTAGLGEAVSVSPLYSRFGQFTIKLEHLANANSWSSIAAHATAVESEKIGLEFQFVAMTSDPRVLGYVTLYTGSYYYLWGLAWDATEDKVYIGGDSVGWTEIASGHDIFQGIPRYHNVKFVVDVDDLNYERVIIDGEVIPVIEKAAYSEENSASPHLIGAIYNGKGPTVANEIYIDYLIITRNEP